MSDTLVTLLEHEGAPTLIHLHHPHHPTSYISTVLARRLPSKVAVARLDGIEHHSPRLVYSTGIARVSSALGLDGVSEQQQHKDYTKWDAFTRGLCDLWSNPARRQNVDKIVLVVSKAERLKTVLGPNWTALTRLADFVSVPVTVVLASQMPWDDIRPTRADAPEPVHIYLEPFRRDQILSQLKPGSRHPLYPRFLDLLLSTIGSLVPTSPPSEVDYLASALWPIYTATLPPHSEQTLLGREYPDPDKPPPPLAITVKLLTDLKHQLSLALAAAVENVLPRNTGRREFTRALMPLSASASASASTSSTPTAGPSRGLIARPLLMDLPLAARYLIVASYCASYNPAKSDVRLFGRGTGPDGKRRRGGGTRRAGYGRTRVGKVPQRLLGPRPFPFDRLLAMFAALYAEHAERPEDLAASYGHGYEDDEKRKENDEWWEDEVDHLTMSVKLWSLIPDLESQGLLRRVSPVDRLDNIVLRCEVDYETAKTIAKDLRITLDEYLYEATM